MGDLKSFDGGSADFMLSHKSLEITISYRHFYNGAFNTEFTHPHRRALAHGQQHKPDIPITDQIPKCSHAVFQTFISGDSMACLATSELSRSRAKADSEYTTLPNQPCSVLGLGSTSWPILRIPKVRGVADPTSTIIIWLNTGS